MKPHNAMYVLAKECPSCHCVPLHKGHDCSSASLADWKDPCPRCGKEVLEYGHRDYCFMCPCCRNCCTALRFEVQLAFYLRGLESPHLN